MKKYSRLISLGIFAVIVLGGVLLWQSTFSKNEKAATIELETELKGIINVSDLSTLEAVYNGVAKVKNKKNPNQIDYYVSYDAKVKAGLDFQAVEIKADAEKKEVLITLPEIKINDINVDIASLDYIFLNNGANTSTVSEQAYKKCIKDVKSETEKEEKIYELAEDNARNVIEALTKPFMEQMYPEYSLVIE